MKPDTVHIGVDVSKEKLDIYVPPQGGGRAETKQLDNDIAGFRALRDLARKAEATVCVEPTGGYELELIAFMHKFGVAVAYADALRVRQFARAEGCHSKSDKVDAALISRFADKIGVRALSPADVESVEHKRRTKFRQTLMDSRTALVCRLETETEAGIRSMIREQIRHLNKLIAKVERSCLETVAKNGAMDDLRRRFTEVGGVGDLTAISILAGLPEIGKLSDEKLNRLVGIAPEVAGVFPRQLPALRGPRAVADPLGDGERHHARHPRRRFGCRVHQLVLPAAGASRTRHLERRSRAPPA